MFHDTMFIGNPVTGRINHDRLEAHGSTFKAIEQPDFLTCADLWFRPVDIKLAPDGSIYVADFYNCMIGHYEVDLHHPRRDRERGRIWRISYTGPAGRKHEKAPDLARAGTSELVEALGYPNMVVRTLAVHQLAERVGKPAMHEIVEPAGKPGVPLLRWALLQGGPHQRVGVLWVLARLGELTVPDAAMLQGDPDRMLRVHLAKALARLDRKNWELTRDLIVELVADRDAFVRRAAADALGQHPDPANINPLIDLWRRTPAEDTHLIHVARISLRDNLSAHPNLATLAAKYRDETDSFRRLADVSLGMDSPAAGEFLLAYLESQAVDAGRVPEFLEHAARRIPDESLAKLFDYSVSLRSDSDDGRQVAILRGLNRALQSRGRPVSPEVREWEAELTTKLLDGKDEGALRTGIDLAREFQIKEAATTLAALAGPDSRLAAVRQQALEALVPLDAPRAIPLLSRLVETGTEPVPARQRGADILGNVNSPESRTELLRLLRVVPDQVALVIARGLAGSKEGAELLVESAVEGKASARLLSDAIVAERLKSAKVPDLAERVETLLKDLPREDERSQKLLASRQAGFGAAKTDLAKGAELFTKTCAACHRVDGKGGKVGPDLDGIGNRGLERLLEDVLAPNRNVDGAFRSSTIVRQDGTIVTGLVVREEGEIVVVVNDQGKEVRVAKGDIDEKKVMNLSPMPANIAEQLSDAEFYNLIAYLLSLKTQPPAGVK
jgi:putative heme-binding domain-containing protein